MNELEEYLLTNNIINYEYFKLVDKKKIYCLNLLFNYIIIWN